jgi:hypothetical protein
MPAIRLEGTGNRDGILIHPGHPPNLYLSSIGCLNPTNSLEPDETMNFWDSRIRVIQMIDDLRNFAPNAFQHEGMARIADAWAVIDGEPMQTIGGSAIPHAEAAAEIEPTTLPISRAAAEKACHWLIGHFSDKLRQATQDKPYQVKHLCAIVCQESAYKWLKWLDQQDVPTILGRCVFDASGDYPGTNRDAFPTNTAAFRKKYGDELTSMLITEANLSRRLQGWSFQAWVYKGYGLFQYDLQSIEKDESFFREKQWYSFDECLRRCCGELDEKLGHVGHDLWRAIAAYNGSGPAAEQYADNVKLFTKYCAEITGEPA